MGIEIPKLVENVEAEKMATIRKNGIWGAAMDLKNDGRITTEQFNEAWGKSTVHVGDKDVPISEAGVVKDAQLRFNASTNTFEVVKAGEHFKVDTNQDLYDAYKKVDKEPPGWLKEAVAEEKHLSTDAEIVEKAAVHAETRPAAKFSDEVLKMNTTHDIPVDDIKGFEKELENNFVNKSFLDQQQAVKALRESTNHLREVVEQEVDATLQKPYENLLAVSEQKLAAMESHASFRAHKEYWGGVQQEWRGKMGLTRQEFGTITKWRVGDVLNIEKQLGSGTYSADTALEEKIALHKEGLEEFAEYLKKLGADSKSSRYFKVGDVLKKTF